MGICGGRALSAEEMPPKMPDGSMTQCCSGADNRRSICHSGKVPGNAWELLCREQSVVKHIVLIVHMDLLVPKVTKHDLFKGPPACK